MRPRFKSHRIHCLREINPSPNLVLVKPRMAYELSPWYNSNNVEISVKITLSNWQSYQKSVISLALCAPPPPKKKRKKPTLLKRKHLHKKKFQLIQKVKDIVGTEENTKIDVNQADLFDRIENIV